MKGGQKRKVIINDTFNIIITTTSYLCPPPSILVLGTTTHYSILCLCNLRAAHVGTFRSSAPLPLDFCTVKLDIYTNTHNFIRQEGAKWRRFSWIS